MCRDICGNDYHDLWRKHPLWTTTLQHALLLLVPYACSFVDAVTPCRLTTWPTLSWNSSVPQKHHYGFVMCKPCATAINKSFTRRYPCHLLKRRARGALIGEHTGSLPGSWSRTGQGRSFFRTSNGSYSLRCAKLSTGFPQTKTMQPWLHGLRLFARTPFSDKLAIIFANMLP